MFLSKRFHICACVEKIKKMDTGMIILIPYVLDHGWMKVKQLVHQVVTMVVEVCRDGI